MTQSSEASIHNIPGTPEIDRLRIPPTRACRYRGRMLTARDFDTLLSIKDSVAGGHDVEVRGTPDGSLRVLEITRKNISAQ